MSQEKLFNKNFICVCIANFCMFFAFYMLLPALPVYLLSEFNASKAIAGVILSSYTVATLVARPFSGFMADRFPRKFVYMVTFFLFIGAFTGYLFATSLLVIGIVRIVHGLFYGTVTTASSTLAMDVMPASRRGAGIGYFGSTSNLAMAIGPMLGLFFVESGSFDIVFYIAITLGMIGLILASFIKVKYRPPIKVARLSLDRFLLVKGIPPMLILILFAFPYGILITYLALLGKEIGINSGTGQFFTIYSIGIILSRLISGKLIDKGYVTKLILLGKIIVLCTFAIFIFTHTIYIFFGAAMFIGLGIGILAPAYQTLFINLAHNNQRGTANSTYLISWDIGQGLGIWIGGYIAEATSYHIAYQVSIIPAIVSTILFWRITMHYFNKNNVHIQ